MRRWRIVGAAAGLLAAVWLTMTLVDQIGDVGASVASYEVENGRFLHRVDAEGVLVAETATKLMTPRGAGEAMKIAWLAADGSAVEEGQVVARFDPTDMENELFQGRSAYAKSETKAEQTTINQTTALENLQRDAEIADLQLAHAREFQTDDAEIYSRTEIIESQIDEGLALRKREHADQTRSIRTEQGSVEMDLLDLEKRQAQLTIDKAEAGLSDLEIRAPHAGILVLQRDWSGDVPTVGAMSWPGNPVGEIPQLDVMRAQLYVLEADAGGLEVGMPVEVVLDAHPGEIFQGTVRRVAAVARRRTRYSPVQYFDIDVSLDTTDPAKMKPGQRVRATILIQDLADVVAIPRDAVFRDADGQEIVYRREGGEYHAIPITLGPLALGRVVVSEGLAPGDVIALQDPRGSTSAPGGSSRSAPPLAPTGGRP